MSGGKSMNWTRPSLKRGSKHDLIGPMFRRGANETEIPPRAVDASISLPRVSILEPKTEEAPQR